VLVPAEDPAALSIAMLALQSDPESRCVLGANARLYAETHFTTASVLEAYDQFFLAVLCTTGLSLAVEEATET
jgi:hypothetical protein